MVEWHMAITKELLQFRAGSPDQIVERMQEMAARNDGRQWLNLQPWVDDRDMPKVSLLKHIFSGRGFAVPTGTWVPGHPGGKPPDVTEVGIQHGAGPRALERIDQNGVQIPDGWQVTQDHPKRGLVVEVGADASHRDALHFLIAAGASLAVDIQIDDRWVAGVVTHDR